MIGRDAMYAKDMMGCICYWEQIYSKIMDPIIFTPIVIQEGFWLMSNWQRDHACSMSSSIEANVASDTTLEDDLEPDSYCGPSKARPKPQFNPY